ncbi:D-Ala-D-Ala carboxypeptidase family metallohydrolase [Colwelliaceae bacterium MEBiC 14330]
MIKFLLIVLLALSVMPLSRLMAMTDSNSFMLAAGINSLVVMPATRHKVHVNNDISVLENAPWLSEISAGVYEVKAPKTPGFYQLATVHKTLGAGKLQLIVKTPIDTAQVKQVNGYQINQYPKPYKGLLQYNQPQGLIEINKADESRYLSDLVQIKDIMCKQRSGYPKYLLVDIEGLKMLDDLYDYLRAQGLNFTRFSFISGYRTPYYNRMIGNGKHSRHLYGDAFDLYIDENGDHRMDDLNQDGRQDKRDVDYLYQLFLAFLTDNNRKGGVGKYLPNSRHGGFVHIDNRGFNARW